MRKSLFLPRKNHHAAFLIPHLKHIGMKKLLLSFTLVLLCFLAFGQPTFLGTDLEGINNNGNFYRTYPLNDLGAFRQVQLTAFAGTNSTISGLPNPRKWEFTSGTSSPDYSVNWRPYDPNQTISGSGYNAIIAPDPVSRTASALYNTGFGGSSGLLTQVVTGSYYTINITEFAPPANQFMSILETNWCHNCRPINSVSGTGCLDECGYEVTVTMAFAPAANEFVYVRYSTDGFFDFLPGRSKLSRCKRYWNSHHSGSRRRRRS
jgi:hypothetical protein